MDVYRDDEAREAAVKGWDNEDGPMDVVSDEFAWFAAEECEYDDPTIRQFVASGQTFTGRVLGFGSSRSKSATHNGHMPGTPLPKGQTCSACRWADVAIMGVNTDDNVPMFLVLTIGKSTIPGEDQRVSTTWTPDALEVLKSLYVKSKNGHPPKIPLPNAAAFRAAAAVDKSIDHVLERFEDIVPLVPEDDIFA
jgi:hypothetical protein